MNAAQEATGKRLEMSFGDSKAVFKQRAQSIGLEEDVIKLFTDAKLDTRLSLLSAVAILPMVQRINRSKI